MKRKRPADMEGLVQEYQSADHHEKLALAKEHGISFGTLKNWITEFAGERDLAEQAEEIHEQAERKLRSSQYKEAIKTIAYQNAQLQAIDKIASVVPAVTVKTTKPFSRSMGRERGSETDCLQLSDTHAGEIVSKEETMGLGCYDMDIMNKRLYLLFEKVIELVDIRRSALHVPRLVIAELGDMLSGEIHPELEITNIEPAMITCVRAAHMISQGIAMISPHFELIQVECVPGNHARLTKKPPSKRRYVNWDYMCYQWQSVFCRDLKNVHFHITKAPFVLANIETSRSLIIHGDTARSWCGIPWYGIERMINNLRSMLMGIDETFDSVQLGHFHKWANLDKGKGVLSMNGSVKGTDEFAAGRLHDYSRPSQNLLRFHSKNGYLGCDPIYLESADKRIEKFDDFLPDVWGDML